MHLEEEIVFFFGEKNGKAISKFRLLGVLTLFRLIWLDPGGSALERGVFFFSSDVWLLLLLEFELESLSSPFLLWHSCNPLFCGWWDQCCYFHVVDSPFLPLLNLHKSKFVILCSCQVVLSIQRRWCEINSISIVLLESIWLVWVLFVCTPEIKRSPISLPFCCQTFLREA